MRKNIALLSVALVVCLVAESAAAEDKVNGKPIKLATLEVSKTTTVTGPTRSVRTVGRQAPVKASKSVSRKTKKRRVHERLVAKINLSTQRMTVLVDGKVRHHWKISSGARGFHTPTGSYKPYYMTSMHYSKKYNNAPMPHSIFFRGGYAVHATGAVRRLGRPASHGCVRLSPGHARQFFKLVSKYRKAGTRIRISGRTPASRRLRSYANNNSRRIRRNRSASWDNFGSYGNNRVNYRRNSVRRIHVGQRRRSTGVSLWTW